MSATQSTQPVDMDFDWEHEYMMLHQATDDARREMTLLMPDFDNVIPPLDSKGWLVRSGAVPHTESNTSSSSSSGSGLVTDLKTVIRLQALIDRYPKVAARLRRDASSMTNAHASPISLIELKFIHASFVLGRAAVADVLYPLAGRCCAHPNPKPNPHPHPHPHPKPIGTLKRHVTWCGPALSK